MREWLHIMVGIVLLSAIFTYDAYAKSNNVMVIECLEVHGYDYDNPDVEERINTFNFRAASGCVSNFIEEKQSKKVAEQREFLKEKPWYKGPNWRWELRSEYTCEHIYSSQTKTNIEVCHKPYYLN
jgi:hypothetical protein